MGCLIPAFGIRVRAVLSGVGGKEAGDYGVLLASAAQAPIYHAYIVV